MDYKVLIKLYVPEIEQEFDLYIPINRSIGQVKILLNKAVNGETLELFPIKPALMLINKRTNHIYQDTDVIKQTDIRNGTELVLL